MKLTTTINGQPVSTEAVQCEMMHIKIMTESETSGYQFRWEPRRFFVLLAENERVKDTSGIFARNVSVAPGFDHLAMLQDFWGGALVELHCIAQLVKPGQGYSGTGFDIHRHDLGAAWLILIIRPALDGVGESGQQLLLRKGQERRDAAAWMRLHRKRTRHILSIYSLPQPGVVGYWGQEQCNRLEADMTLLCRAAIEAAKWVEA